jgi:hypothetical protein
MRTSNEPKHWAIVGTIAAILLIVWTTALGTSPATARESATNQAQVTIKKSDSEELVKLEDSLQWTGQDPIEMPASLSVTDLLPARC